MKMNESVIVSNIKDNILGISLKFWTIRKSTHENDNISNLLRVQYMKLYW